MLRKQCGLWTPSKVEPLSRNQFYTNFNASCKPTINEFNSQNAHNYKTGRDNHSPFRFHPILLLCVPVLTNIIDRFERRHNTYSASHLSNTPHNSPLQPTTMTSVSLYRRSTAHSQKPQEPTNSAHYYHLCL